jgi:hypothetical protein
MKRKRILLLLTCLFLAFLPMQAQLVINASFETDGMPNLDGWVDPCGFTSFVQDTPPDGGIWSLGVPSGNTQGCFPGYVYQILPDSVLAQNTSYKLSGWVKNPTDLTAGIYFGTIDDLDQVELALGDTTTAAEWTFLSASYTFDLLPNQRAVIIMSGGLTGGPVGPGDPAQFDLIQLEGLTSLTEVSQLPINVFPNPASDQVRFELPEAGQLSIVNAQGILVEKFEHLHSHSRSFLWNSRNLESGLYFYHFQTNNKEAFGSGALLLKH